MLAVLASFVPDTLDAAKQRKWRGPSLYIEGTPPIALDSFGFAPLLDRFFVYGGWDTNNGEAFNYHLISNFIGNFSYSTIRYESHSVLTMIYYFAVVVDNLYQVDPSKMFWTDLANGAVLGKSPGPRYAIGTCSLLDSVYIFGGFATWTTDLGGTGVIAKAI